MRTLRRLARNRLTLLGFLGLLALIAIAITAPAWVPFPDHGGPARDVANRLQPPGPVHRFGTDDFGRDIFSRVCLGAVISLRTGVIVVLLASTLGVTLGAAAGFAGGLVDEVIMRITDAFLAIPSLVLALAISTALGASLTNALLAISLVWWPWYARLIRAQVMAIKEQEFVESARSLGMGPFLILTRHILPNALAPILVQASMDFGYVILTAASLGFLGLGAQPPTPEWGLMVSVGRKFFPRWWWVATFPGLAIFLAVLCFNLVGDGLREVLDPRLRKQDA
ncbi:MAG: ABC transporter permease [bacterium]|nr:ABC transporter permease [bacterium]